jgi:hypothetical protein
MVWGWEIDDPGQDAELKALIGWRFSDDVRVGLEARVQTEVHDENGFKGPTMNATDLIAGPVAFWRVARPVTLQVLVGVGKPAMTNQAGVIALGGFSIDL